MNTEKKKSWPSTDGMADSIEPAKGPKKTDFEALAAFFKMAALAAFFKMLF